jgi:hypothetical protein
MRIVATFKPVGLIALALALTSPFAGTLQDVEAVLGRDGLEKTGIKDIDLAYARPGATLAGYQRVKLDPVEVEFSERWNPERTGSRLKVTGAEREAIRADVASFVQEEFARELQRNGGYQLTTDTGPDVLRIKPRILDLYVNAPGADNAARTRTFVSSTGEMTLLAELSDAASGQVLERFADRREATSAFIRLQRTNRFVNENEARTIANAWARILRKELDRAHGGGS